MRKRVAIFLALVLALSLFACGKGRVEKDTSKAPTTPRMDEVVETEPNDAADKQSELEKNDESAMPKIEQAEETEPVTTPVVQSEEPQEEDDAVETQRPAEASRENGIRPEFKEAMDAYEEFYGEYCDLMKRYEDDPTDLTVLMKYLEMLTKAEEMTEKFEAWDEDDMSNEELLYYMEVNSRVVAMLLELGE